MISRSMEAISSAPLISSVKLCMSTRSLSESQNMKNEACISTSAAAFFLKASVAGSA
ncbi:hypothetical protein D3C71_2207010 [compost metagenome]